MSISELALTELPFAATYLLTVGGLAFGVVPVNRSRLRLARNCFMAASVIFAGIAIMWGIWTEYPFWPRVLIVGLLAALAAIGAMESTRFIMRDENLKKESENAKSDPAPTIPVTTPAATTVSAQAPAGSAPVADPQPQRRPTLEATRNSKIDATGSIIPGDLPFQFGKADDGSIIDMPGTIVTRKEDGSIVIMPGAMPVNRTFPPPTGEFASLSASALKARAGEIAGSLREFQGRFETEMRSLPRTSPPQVRAPDVMWKQFSEKYKSEYNTKLLDPAVSVASEIMSRIEASAPGTSFQHPGANMLYHRAFAGPAPALEVAEFLDLLVSKLPGERDQGRSRAQNKLK